MMSKIAICFLCGLFVTTAAAFGQSSGTSKSGSGDAAASNRDSSGDNVGFAIETEMFTYKAVTQNSEVLACDVARYLYGGEVSAAPDESHVPCVIKAGTQTDPGIIIVSSTGSVLADFQMWRTDMVTMGDLEMRAAKVCAKSPGPSGPVERGLSASKALSGVLDLTPEGQALSLFEGTLGMLATNQSVTSVMGTVRDQALMNEVARQLRSLNVQVLIPEIYNPYTLSGSDYKNSLYMANLERLFDSRQLCETAKADNPAPARAAQIDSVIGSIESFLKMAMAAPGSSPAAAGGSTTPPQPSASAASHFAAVFAADGLARQLGFSQDGVTGPSDTWQHILWLKALESGGSVAREGNILGTKILYSGGAVETYAVFGVDGTLVCSGNVYNFESPVHIKDLQNSFRAKAAKNPAESPQVRSTCGMPPRTSVPATDPPSGR